MTPNQREIDEAILYIREAAEYLDELEHSEGLALESLEQALELLGANE